MSPSDICFHERKAAYQKARACFIVQGTTLNEWCRENGSHIQNVRDAVFGRWKGPRADDLVRRVTLASTGSAR